MEWTITASERLEGQDVVYLNLFIACIGIGETSNKSYIITPQLGPLT